jgi:D-proline reductase (dithiol) PrdB
VGLVARHLEANGIPTVTFTCARDITEAVRPPRSVFVDYPLGSTCGRPFDPANQRAVILAGLRLLETGRTPGEIVDLPYVWSEDETRKRLIFSPEQPFLSDEAEARRQAGLDAARTAKRQAQATSAD